MKIIGQFLKDNAFKIISGLLTLIVAWVLWSTNQTFELKAQARERIINYGNLCEDIDELKIMGRENRQLIMENQRQMALNQERIYQLLLGLRQQLRNDQKERP